MELTSEALGSWSVRTLFRNIFYPTVLGMLSVSAVTVIDGIFVGHGVGSDGIAAINICTPFFMIVSGVALMLGTGCSVMASVCLAKGKEGMARNAASQSVLAGLAFSLALICAIVFASGPFARLLGASDTLAPMVSDYLIGYSPGILFDVLIIQTSFLVRLDGAPKLAMIASILSALVNVVLDYIFIFPLGMGVFGAAVASSISCFAGAAIQVSYLIFKARSLRLARLKFSCSRVGLFLHSISRQGAIGSTALLGELVMATLMYVGNLVFMKYLGDDGVGAFGIACYYLPFVFMIGNSIAQSAQPVISYNYGLSRWDRVREGLRVSLRYAIGCGLVATLAFTLVPKVLVGLFLPLEENAAKIAVDGFPLFSLAFLFFVCNLSIIGYWQSTEQVSRSTVFSILRGVLFVPMAFLLPYAFGARAIWAALAISEGITFAIIAIQTLFGRGRRGERPCGKVAG